MRVLVAALLSMVSAVALAAAGEVTLLTGKATATAPDGVVRELRKGSEVNSGEIVSAQSGTYLNLKFRDGGLILLRPNTRFQIERYDYEPKPVAKASGASPTAGSAQAPVQGPTSPTPVRSRAFFRLLKGGLRTVTGLIGRVQHNDYRLSTPTATIGIRGTEVFAYTCEAGCSNDPAVLNALKDVFGDKNFSFKHSDIIGTLSGETEVTNGTTGEKTGLPKGQFIISTTTDEGNVPLHDPTSNMGGGGDLLKLSPEKCKK